VAWSLQLLDAHDPGRLGRALDGRTTALDHASRQPGPRCPPDPANPVAAHPAAAPMAAAVVAGLAGHGHGPAPPPRSSGGALHEPTTPPGPWPERAGPAGRGGRGRPPPDRSSWSSGGIAPRCTPLGGPLSRHAPPTRTTGSRRTWTPIATELGATASVRDTSQQVPLSDGRWTGETGANCELPSTRSRDVRSQLT
jgi:hypothetical protein